MEWLAGFSKRALNGRGFSRAVTIRRRGLEPLRPQLRQLAHELYDAMTQQRFAAGKSNLGDTHSHQHPSHAQIIREGKIPVERAFISGAAIDTLVIAAIGDGDPQIGNRAPEFVVKSSH